MDLHDLVHCSKEGSVTVLEQQFHQLEVCRCDSRCIRQLLLNQEVNSDVGVMRESFYVLCVICV